MRARQIFAHYDRGQGETAGLYRYCPFCGEALDKGGERPRARCASCGYCQFRNPAPTVSVLVVEGGRVLLGRRGSEPGRGTWSLPSGYIDWEEDYISAAVRETREETGLEVEVEELITLVSSFVSPGYHFLGVYLTARAVGGELQAGDDLEAVAWFPLEGPLPALGFEEDREIIAGAAQGWAGLPVNPERAKLF